MKVIEVIVKGIIRDLVPGSIELNSGTILRGGLSLSDDDLALIRQRIELIFDIRIPKEPFLLKSTYGELCEFVLSIFNQHEELKKLSAKP